MRKLILFAFLAAALCCGQTKDASTRILNDGSDPTAAKYRTVYIGGCEIGDGSAAITTAQLTNNNCIENNADAKTATRITCWTDDDAGQAVVLKIASTTVSSITCKNTQSGTNGTAGIMTTGFGSTAITAGAKLDLSGTANTTTKDLKIRLWGTVN